MGQELHPVKTARCSSTDNPIEKTQDRPWQYVLDPSELKDLNLHLRKSVHASKCGGHAGTSGIFEGLQLCHKQHKF